MQQKKNVTKNRYQIIVIISVLMCVVYAFVLYNRVRIFQYRHIFLYVAIEIAWILLTVYWWLQWRKQKRQEKENGEN